MARLIIIGAIVVAVIGFVMFSPRAEAPSRTEVEIEQGFTPPPHDAIMEDGTLME